MTGRQLTSGVESIHEACMGSSLMVSILLADDSFLPLFFLSWSVNSVSQLKTVMLYAKCTNSAHWPTFYLKP